MEKGPSEFAEYWTSEYEEVNHFYFHADEFGYQLITEYSKAAYNFANEKGSKILSFTANAKKYWSTYKYKMETNEFMIISRGGKIVTYFPPDKGIKYFYDQFNKWGDHWN